MEWLSSLCSILALLMELIVVPACVVWLIITIVKKKDIKLPRNVLIGCVVAFIVFNGIGRATWVSPDDEVNTEDTSQDTLADADDSESKTEKDTQKDTSTQKDSETEEIAELSEEEYKAMCQEMYQEELLEGDVWEGDKHLGKHVKIYALIAEKARYEPDSVFEFVIKDLREQYDIDRTILSLGVLNEEKKSFIMREEDKVYLLFNKEYGLSADDCDSFGEIIVYGEIVQVAQRIFIFPRYIEPTEGLINWN